MTDWMSGHTTSVMVLPPADVGRAGVAARPSPVLGLLVGEPGATKTNDEADGKEEGHKTAVHIVELVGGEFGAEG